MIEALRQWLVGIIVASLLVSVADSLMPEGGVKKIAGFTGGLILLLALVQPVLRITPGSIDGGFASYGQEIAQLEEEFSKSNAQALEAGIAVATQAYISDKAESLGISCQVKVETAQGAGGRPYPVSVVMDCAYVEPLAEYLATELGITRERQTWKGT